VDFYFDSSKEAESYLALCQQYSFSPKSIILLHNFPSVIMAVRQGKGMTLCGIDVKYTYGADIKYYKISDMEKKLPMVLAWNPEHISHEMREFLEIISLSQ